MTAWAACQNILHERHDDAKPPVSSSVWLAGIACLSANDHTARTSYALYGSNDAVHLKDTHLFSPFDKSSVGRNGSPFVAVNLNIAAALWLHFFNDDTHFTSKRIGIALSVVVTAMQVVKNSGPNGEDRQDGKEGETDHLPPEGKPKPAAQHSKKGTNGKAEDVKRARGHFKYQAYKADEQPKQP